MVGGIVAILLTAFLLFAAFYKFPNVVFLPGSADSVGQRLRVEKSESYQPQGKILWATVSQVVEPRFIDMVDAWLRDDVDIVRKKEVLGDATPAENRKFNQDLMDNSKQVAAVVAARRLGIPTSGGAIRILDVDLKAPAAKILKADDEIVTIDGQPLCLVGDLQRVFAAYDERSKPRFGIRRGGKGPIVEVQVPLVRLDSGRMIVGMFAGPSESAPCSTPFGVSIRTGAIGGPSAGLAMTLALLDQLTEGELTGGKIVAATGTIEADGSVGLVGGVKQKTFAVKKAKAVLFLVPKDEAADAKKYAGAMKVVGVDTLDEALLALRAIGGDALPPTSVGQLGDL